MMMIVLVCRWGCKRMGYYLLTQRHALTYELKKNNSNKTCVWRACAWDSQCLTCLAPCGDWWSGRLHFIELIHIFYILTSLVPIIYPYDTTVPRIRNAFYTLWAPWRRDASVAVLSNLGMYKYKASVWMTMVFTCYLCLGLLYNVLYGNRYERKMEKLILPYTAGETLCVLCLHIRYAFLLRLAVFPSFLPI